MFKLLKYLDFVFIESFHTVPYIPLYFANYLQLLILKILKWNKKNILINYIIKQITFISILHLSNIIDIAKFFLFYFQST